MWLSVAARAKGCIYVTTSDCDVVKLNDFKSCTTIHTSERKTHFFLESGLKGSESAADDSSLMSACSCR